MRSLQAAIDTVISQPCYLISFGVGRRSEITEVSADLEYQKIDGCQPCVFRVIGVKVGIEGNRELDLKPVACTSDDTERGRRRGWRCFALERGLYVARGILGSSQRIHSSRFSLTEHGLLEHEDSDEFTELLKALYPDAYALSAQRTQTHEALLAKADELLAAIREERAAVEEVTVDGITAAPEFDRSPSIEDVVASLRTGAQAGEAFDEDEYIVSRAQPSHYVVSAPVFAKADTAEAAIEAATKIVAERAQAVARAKDAAAELGMPALTGTPRQVSWAMQIRARFALANPRHAALKRATTAKYWIDNHR